MTVTGVSAHSDVGLARRRVRDVAAHIGFEGHTLAEIEIIATELATNLAAHGSVNGRLVAAATWGAESPAVEIVSCDQGPGIADLDTALRDHRSTADSMGCGLGAVQRLSDEFDVLTSTMPEKSWLDHGPPAAPGTIIMARKWLLGRGSPPPLICAVRSRPFPGETENGDGCFLLRDGEGLLIAVADGLGHGPAAYEASQAVARHIAANSAASLHLLLLELHEVLRRTRGAAVTLVRVDPIGRKLFHSGIGNVGARLYPREAGTLLERGGTLGCGLPPRPRVTELDWPEGGTLVVFSDEISGR